MTKCGFSCAMVAAVLTLALSGCASDDLTLPEPELEMPGTFVAVDGYDADDEITLIRTIDRLDFKFETLLFFTIYDVKPQSFDEARELSKRTDLPLRVEIEAQPRPAITVHPWRVVWFRTLTDDEERRVK